MAGAAPPREIGPGPKCVLLFIYICCFALDYYKYYRSDSERELTFEVNLPYKSGRIDFQKHIEMTSRPV